MAQYVATAKKATSVRKSLVCHFTDQHNLNLVIAKGARLEIWDITADGLQHRLDVPLYGAIATMEAYRLQDESCDRMFVLTERYQFCVLQFDGERQVSRITYMAVFSFIEPFVDLQFQPYDSRALIILLCEDNRNRVSAYRVRLVYTCTYRLYCCCESRTRHGMIGNRHGKIPSTKSNRSYVFKI